MLYREYPAFTISFEENDERTFWIKGAGFHNFNFIRPIKHFRIQNFFTLHIILEGSGTVKVEDREYKASKGDMFFIPPKVRLCYYPEEGDPWKYVWFEFLGENASVYGKKMGFEADVRLKRCKGFENIVFLLDRIFTDRMNGIQVGYYEILSVFYKILDRNIRKSSIQDMTDAVMNYIDCNYARADFTVPEICGHFHISHSYLCKLFKETQKGTVKNYVVKVRINEACRLLETTDMSIQEIAYAVGFSDSVHFMKMFKKHMEKTPAQYRASRTYPM